MDLSVVLKSFMKKNKNFHKAAFLKGCAVDSADLIGRLSELSTHGLKTSEV